MDAKIFQKYLKDEVFKKKKASDAKSLFQKFNKLLIDNNALVAGGSVLSQYVVNKDTTKSFESSDLDIYVSEKNAKSFIQGILRTKTLDLDSDKFHFGGTYDRSFLSKNSISYILRLYPNNNDEYMVMKNIDIMITKKDPIDVVQNFDLTCCQIWYDGTTVNSTHNVTDKNCELRKDYHAEWILGNRFLKTRVDKYSRRGFNIKIDLDVKDICVKDIAITCGKDILAITLPMKKIVNYEHFFLMMALRKMVSPGSLQQVNIGICLDLVKDGVTFDEMCKVMKTNLPGGYKYMPVIWRYFWTSLHDMWSFPFNSDFKKQFEAGVCRYEGEDSLLKYKIAFFTLMVSYVNYNKHSNIYIQPEIKQVFHAKQPDEKECLREVCNIESTQMIAESKHTFDLPKTIYDIFTIEEIPISKDDMSRFIFNAPDGPLTFLREDFMSLVMDINNWMYECTGDIINGSNDRRLITNFDMIYVKVPANSGGRNSLFRIDNIYELISARNCVFEIRDTGLSLTHTMSFAQYNSRKPTYVSVNHCQYGSKMDIMEFAEYPAYRFGSSVEISPLALYGSGNKKKDYTCVGKRVVIGRERNIYKKASDRKLFVSYKKDYMPIKEYEKLMAATK